MSWRTESVYAIKLLRFGAVIVMSCELQQSNLWVKDNVVCIVWRTFSCASARGGAHLEHPQRWDPPKFHRIPCDEWHWCAVCRCRRKSSCIIAPPLVRVSENIHLITKLSEITWAVPIEPNGSAVLIIHFTHCDSTCLGKMLDFASYAIAMDIVIGLDWIWLIQTDPFIYVKIEVSRKALLFLIWWTHLMKAALSNTLN